MSESVQHWANLRNWLGQSGMDRLRLIEAAPVEPKGDVWIAEVRVIELTWLCGLARAALAPGGDGHHEREA